MSPGSEMGPMSPPMLPVNGCYMQQQPQAYPPSMPFPSMNQMGMNGMNTTNFYLPQAAMAPQVPPQHTSQCPRLSGFSDFVELNPSSTTGSTPTPTPPASVTGEEPVKKRKKRSRDMPAAK